VIFIEEDFQLKEEIHVKQDAGSKAEEIPADVQEKEGQKPRILNVGCGADEYGTDFVDLYPMREAIVKCNIEAEELPYSDNTFDEVYCRGLFEHLKNPNEYLRKVRRVLRPGGRVVIITDNASYWVWALDKSLHRGGYEKPEHPDDRHFALYTEHHMKNHLSEVGFVNVTTTLHAQPVYMGFGKRAFGKFVNGLFRITPLRKMAYMHLRAVGFKPVQEVAAVSGKS